MPPIIRTIFKIICAALSVLFLTGAIMALLFPMMIGINDHSVLFPLMAIIELFFSVVFGALGVPKGATSGQITLYVVIGGVIALGIVCLDMVGIYLIFLQ